MGHTDVDAQFNQGFYERLNSLKNYRLVDNDRQLINMFC